MRHRVDGNRLGRNSSLRKATVRDIARAALIHQRICTTKAKAKEARRLVEKLITLGKRADLSSKRRAFAILCDHHLVSDLFNKTAARFKSRMGGYTRIIPLGLRRGDNAHLVYLELTEKEIVVPAVKAKTSKQEKLQPPEGKWPKLQEKKDVGEIPKPETAKPAKKIMDEAKKESSAKYEGAAQKRTQVVADKTKPAKKNVLSGIKNIFQKRPPPSK